MTCRSVARNLLSALLVPLWLTSKLHGAEVSPPNTLLSVQIKITRDILAWESIELQCDAPQVLAINGTLMQNILHQSAQRGKHWYQGIFGEPLEVLSEYAAYLAETFNVAENTARGAMTGPWAL